MLEWLSYAAGYVDKLFSDLENAADGYAPSDEVALIRRERERTKAAFEECTRRRTEKTPPRDR